MQTNGSGDACLPIGTVDAGFNAEAVNVDLTTAHDVPVVLRPRLFDLLDTSSSRYIVWLSAPPGSGKTTLAASYLCARERRHIRVPLKQHHADPANFFHALRSGFAATPWTSAVTLPECLPDDIGNPRIYAQQFVRRVIEQLQGPWVLVLDDYQEIGDTTSLHAALAGIAEVLPDGVQLWILSRSEPAPAFARARAAGQLFSVNARQLKFSLAECRSLLGERHVNALPLHAITDGWAAGLVLLRESGRLDQTTGQDLYSNAAMPEQWFFDYFATVVFDQLCVIERRVLLRIAALPFLTGATADTLTFPDPGAAVLERLHRRNLFIECRFDVEPVYILHALFRSFLEHRAKQLLPSDEWSALRRRIADMLIEQGAHDLAFDALFSLREYDAALALVLRAAPETLAAGRLQSLTRWVDALSVSLQRQPMLRYWRAACQMHEDPGTAAKNFALAQHQLQHEGDTIGELLAIAGYCEATVMTGRDLASLDRWIVLFELRAEGCLAQVDTGLELRLLPGFLAALGARQPHHPLLATLVERAEMLLDQDPAARQRILFGAVANCFIDHGQHERMGRLVQRVESIDDPSSVPPSVRLRWLHAMLFWKTLRGRLEEAEQDAVEARELCATHDLRRLRSATSIMGAQVHWVAGQAVAAREELRQARDLVGSDNLVQCSVIEFLEGVIALQQGQPQVAVTALHRAVALACDAGSPGRERVARFELALALTENGDLDAAEIALGDARRHPSFSRSPFHQWVTTMIQANLADRRNDSVMLVQALEAGTRIARLHGYRYAPGLFATGIMPRLCVRALTYGIDVPLVEEWIRIGRLHSPDITCSRWPWPLRVRFFGGLVMERWGLPLPRGRKTARKPIDLLAHLVAAGGEASVDRLAGELWPEMELHQARAVFDNTLHRLRRLLGVNGAIVAREAGIAIDETLVRIDALVFRRLVTSVRQALAIPGDAVALDRLSTELLLTGATPFLAGEDRYPALVTTRRQITLTRLQLLLRIAKRFAECRDTNAAIELLERVVEQNPLAEDVCRMLMQLHMAQGDSSEALAVYRRLREALARSTGSMPSSESVRLATHMARHSVELNPDLERQNQSDSTSPQSSATHLDLKPY